MGHKGVAQEETVPASPGVCWGEGGGWAETWDPLRGPSPTGCLSHHFAAPPPDRQSSPVTESVT